MNGDTKKQSFENQVRDYLQPISLSKPEELMYLYKDAIFQKRTIECSLHRLVADIKCAEHEITNFYSSTDNLASIDKMFDRLFELKDLERSLQQSLDSSNQNCDAILLELRRVKSAETSRHPDTY